MKHIVIALGAILLLTAAGCAGIEHNPGSEIREGADDRPMEGRGIVTGEEGEFTLLRRRGTLTGSEENPDGPVKLEERRR